jgi:hypothetical protein
MSRSKSLLVATLGLAFFAGLTALAARAQSEDASQEKQKPAAAQASHKLGEAEDVSGTILLVDTSDSTMTVAVNGTPCVFRLTKKTKIQIGGSKGNLDALAKQINQNVTVHFVPRSDGNYAETVDVKGS